MILRCVALLYVFIALRLLPKRVYKTFKGQKTQLFKVIKGRFKSCKALQASKAP